jgi:hypothetical protein
MVLDGRGWSYLSVNHAGARLWERLADGATRADLESELVTAYAIDHDIARADVERFLDGLRAHDLIEEAR